MLVVLILLMVPPTARADEPIENINVTGESMPVSSPFVIKPIDKITIEGIYDPDASKHVYCFANEEGRCLKEDYNLFTDIEGGAKYDDRFSVYYKAEFLNAEPTIKKVFGVLKTGIWSWEVGRDSIWVGVGYHGSFLLSDNADDFLLARVKTDEPFRFPWFLSSLGDFKYDIFRGWSDNSSLLGQSLTWLPTSIVQLGFNEVVYIPETKHYALYEYPGVFFSTTGAEAGTSSTKCSFDLAIDMPFLADISFFTGGKIYGEYAFDDYYAWWKTVDRGLAWKGLGIVLMNTAWRAGLALSTENTEFHFEYANNINTVPWYNITNVREGVIMGDSAGNLADDLYFEFDVHDNPWNTKLFYDQERQGEQQNDAAAFPPPQFRYEVGIKPSYRFSKTLTLFADLIYNHYRNLNLSTDPTLFDIHPGTRRDEIISGLGIEVRL